MVKKKPKDKKNKTKNGKESNEGGGKNEGINTNVNAIVAATSIGRLDGRRCVLLEYLPFKESAVFVILETGYAYFVPFEAMKLEGVSHTTGKGKGGLTIGVESK